MHGDVFRKPRFGKLLAVSVGSGVAWSDFADGKGLGLTATAGNVEQRSNVFKIYLIWALLSLFIYIYI